MVRALFAVAVTVVLAGGAFCENGGDKGADEGSRVAEGSMPSPEALEAQKAALAEGQKLFSKKDYAGLRAALTPLTRSEFPEIAYPAKLWIAKAHLAEKAPDRAIPLLIETAARYEPLAPEARYQLGQAYMRKRRYATARECFRDGHACGESPFADDCLYYVAYTRYIDRHYGLACGAFELFLGTYPDSGLAKSATKLLEQSRKKLREARKVTVGWVANLGLASSLEQVSLGQTEFGVGANARLGGTVRWEPRDGVRMNANAYGTRTNYLTGDLGDRQGVVAGLSISQDLGDARSLGYGLSYGENQRVDIDTSDSRTRGLWTSLRLPFGDTGAFSLYVNASDLKYYSVVSSGSQYTISASYSDKLSDTLSLGLGTTFTTSEVGAEYLSYNSPGVSMSLSERLSKRRSARAGFTYTARNFAAPRPKQTLAREDRQRGFYAEYSQRFTDKLTVTVGWREDSRSSNDARLNNSDPSWYIRTTSLVDLKF